jgi:hypothetical protein
MYNASFLNLYLVPHGVIRAYVIAAAFRERCVCTNKLKYTTGRNPPYTRAAGDVQEEWAKLIRSKFISTSTGPSSPHELQAPLQLHCSSCHLLAGRPCESGACLANGGWQFPLIVATRRMRRMRCAAVRSGTGGSSSKLFLQC